MLDLTSVVEVFAFLMDEDLDENMLYDKGLRYSVTLDMERARVSEMGCWLLPVLVVPCGPRVEGQSITIWLDRRSGVWQYQGPSWKEHHGVYYARMAYEKVLDTDAAQREQILVQKMWGVELPPPPKDALSVPAPVVVAEMDISIWK